MVVPADFKYKAAYIKGRPQHEKYSDFWRRHIPMDHTHRAKLFTAFDALKGFDEAIAAKRIQYVPRKTIDEELLDEKLRMLNEHRENATITYFVQCDDPFNDAYDNGLGLYRTISGSVWRIDVARETLWIKDIAISFEDIADIKLEEEE